MKISQRGAIPPFIVMDVMKAAAEREAAGEGVLHMEVGQPGTPAPQVARDALVTAMQTDALGYTVALGLPALRARTTMPELSATSRSMPVATSGGSVRSNGTAWRCMLEPINARLASSFSRNGISAVATETSCLGDTSINSMFSGAETIKSPLCHQLTRDSVKLPFSSIVALA